MGRNKNFEITMINYFVMLKVSFFASLAVLKSAGRALCRMSFTMWSCDVAVAVGLGNGLEGRKRKRWNDLPVT